MSYILHRKVLRYPATCTTTEVSRSNRNDFNPQNDSRREAEQAHAARIPQRGTVNNSTYTHPSQSQALKRMDVWMVLMAGAAQFSDLKLANCELEDEGGIEGRWEWTHCPSCSYPQNGWRFLAEFLAGAPVTRIPGAKENKRRPFLRRFQREATPTDGKIYGMLLLRYTVYRHSMCMWATSSDRLELAVHT